MTQFREAHGFWLTVVRRTSEENIRGEGGGKSFVIRHASAVFNWHGIIDALIG